MNFNRPLILASNSPRRQQLLKEVGFDFDIKTIEVDESYPQDMEPEAVAAYLSRKKADAFEIQNAEQVVVTADTTVIIQNQLLEKPLSKSHAVQMLSTLSGRGHTVITAFTIKDSTKIHTRSCKTMVYFNPLSEVDIHFYVDHYNPMDKAGAYGIQEWIGMIGVEKIEGSYFNVVGLPVAQLYDELLNHFS